MWSFEFPGFCCSACSHVNHDVEIAEVPTSKKEKSVVEAEHAPEEIRLGNSAQWREHVGAVGSLEPWREQTTESQFAFDTAKLQEHQQPSNLSSERERVDSGMPPPPSGGTPVPEFHAPTFAPVVGAQGSDATGSIRTKVAVLTNDETPAFVQRNGVLGTTVQCLAAAVVFDSAGSSASALRRSAFIDGIEAYASALDTLGGNMGSYLITNVKKMRNSKATATEDDYMEWLFSELPVHKSTGYKSYVDDSAWMGNLWLGWSMEFFVEFFALLHEGQETKASVEAAYAKTLKAHHNFFQSTAFHQACKQMPPRQQLLDTLRGSADPGDVERELAAFVKTGRAAVEFCLKMNVALDKRLKEERSKKK